MGDWVLSCGSGGLQQLVRNNREVFFEPSLAGDDRKFLALPILFNPKTNSLIVLGYLEIDKKK